MYFRQPELCSLYDIKLLIKFSDFVLTLFPSLSIASMTDQLTLPVSVVTKLLKSGLPDDIALAGATRTMCAQATGVFVLHLTAAASERARKAKRATLNGDDVLGAIQELGMPVVAAGLAAYAEATRGAADGAKRARTAAGAGAGVDDEEADVALDDVDNNDDDNDYNEQENNDDENDDAGADNEEEEEEEEGQGSTLPIDPMPYSDDDAGAGAGDDDDDNNNAGSEDEGYGDEGYGDGND